MIAMQYSLTLPADYDMSIIDRRIRDRGPLLDGFPHLKFKAYLRAAKGDLGSHDNLYAPFYVWNEPNGASNFLFGPGFQAIIRDFGRPDVNVWIVWDAHIAPDLKDAKFATREVVPMGSQTALGEIKQRECERALADLTSGDVLASVAGFEPTTWSVVRFRLWRQRPEAASNSEVQAYRVGHIST